MTWTVSLEHDGQPTAEHIPIDDYDLATLIAPLFAAWTGQPTSVAHAVHQHRADTTRHDQLFPTP